MRRSVIVLVASVGFVLLIACANVANLMYRVRPMEARVAESVARRRFAMLLLSLFKPMGPTGRISDVETGRGHLDREDLSTIISGESADVLTQPCRLEPWRDHL